jgi:ABC-type nickel/cobalt efflux system permease component RcnA
MLNSFFTFLITPLSFLVDPFPTTSVTYLLGIGFVYGLRHAIEADHLAAVTTIVTESKSVLRSGIVGLCWGLGHTISLLLAAVVVLWLKLNISEETARWLEFSVGTMLAVLGINALYKLFKHRQEHQSGIAHHHPWQNHPSQLITADHNNSTANNSRNKVNHTHFLFFTWDSTLSEKTGFSAENIWLITRAILVGMIHGLAGSAALLLLVVASTNSQTLGLAYVGSFGLGSIGGMWLMSLVVSLPFYFAQHHFQRFETMLQLLAAGFSFAFGLLIMYKLGFSNGL